MHAPVQVEVSAAYTSTATCTLLILLHILLDFYFSKLSTREHWTSYAYFIETQVQSMMMYEHIVTHPLLLPASLASRLHVYSGAERLQSRI